MLKQGRCEGTVPHILTFLREQGKTKGGRKMKEQNGLPHDPCLKCGDSLAKAGITHKKGYYYQCTSCKTLVHRGCYKAGDKCLQCGHPECRPIHLGPPALSWFKRRKLPKGHCKVCGDSLQSAPVPGEEGLFEECKRCSTLFHRRCVEETHPPCPMCGGTGYTPKKVKV